MFLIVPRHSVASVLFPRHRVHPGGLTAFALLCCASGAHAVKPPGQARVAVQHARLVRGANRDYRRTA